MPASDRAEATPARRGIIVLTIATAVALVILVGLGLWQLERRTWKLGLIERIETRVKAPPVPLAKAIDAARASGDVEYLRVEVSGTFAGTRLWIYAPGDAGLGYNLVQPLITPQGDLVLVNRGWVPDTVRADDSRAASLRPAAPVTVTGLVRKQAPASVFAPAADPARAEFYWPDYDGMRQALPPDVLAGRAPAPFAIDAQEEAPKPSTWPRAGTTNLTIPNRHLEYALTWFGLAATLVGVYLALVTSKRR